MNKTSNPRPGGRFRRTLFWVHLSCGVATGLVILMMSATGVLLTYERQILDWAERSAHVEAPPGATRLPLADLLATTAAADFRPSGVTISADPAAPVIVTAGRRDQRRVDPYTGAALADGAADLRAFFGTVTEVHRWFAAGDERRDVARHVTGASNLVFLLLALSGLVLWWPKAWRWAWVRGRLWFRPRYATAKARDFNWHHVLGFWCAVPLIAITATAAVFSYGWASDLVYLAAGDEPPPPRRGPPGREAVATPDPQRLHRAEAAVSLDTLFKRAAKSAGAWNRATITLSAAAGDNVSIRFDRGTGGEPQKMDTLELDPLSGEVVTVERFADRSAGARARSIVRFLHTGEVLGIAGQTVAGLASLAGILLVWTGLALAYRRLLLPVLRRSASRTSKRSLATR